MSKTLKALTFATILLCYFSCQKDGSENIQRPHSPWVFRSVLDSLPRMVTAALHDDLYVAYQTQTGAIYKAWKGGVNFDGAVYTTAHGPQPSSLGDGWFIGKYSSPWKVVKNGEELLPKIQYRGHRFENGHVVFNLELILPDGHLINVTEQPEYVTNSNGLTGLERTFTTANVPEGAQVVLLTNLSSIALETNVTTNGQWTVSNKADRSYKSISGFDLEGSLALNTNGTTTFTAYFTQKPLIENTNKIAGAEDAEDLPLGMRLIARSDCKTCHNTYVATVGPAYVEVAKRYRNNEDNVLTLINKVKNGGAGVWGEAAMTPHADLPDSDLRHMVEYIMGLDALEEANQPEVVNVAELQLMDGAEGIEASAIYPGAIARIYKYDRSLSKLADLAPFPKPIYEGIIPTLHAQEKDLIGLDDNFGIVTEGYLKIPKDNNYTFRLISDDGSKLTIDNKVIIDHDGLHGGDAKDGEVALKEGYHPFRVDYFESGGGNNISFQWKSFDDKNAGFTIVPASVLSHKKDDQPEHSNPVPFASSKKVPGDKIPVEGVHPSYDLSQARPDDFFPKVGGMDFLSDGRLVVSLWDAEGGVYIIDNVASGDPAQMTAKKIAAGLAEPLGLKVVDDEIFVLQKQELTQLIDHDGDELTDEYRTHCNAWGVSGNFHEFAFGLAYKVGHFYGSLATDILPGGAGAKVQPKDRGRTFKISKADGSLELITSGLRTPNGIGIGVDGEIFNADNQGDWLPASKIVHITKGSFYGSRAVDFAGTENLTEKKPVVWLPQDEIGNSPATPLALNDGPYKGQMIHCEVTHGGVKRVFVEKVNGEYQGAVFRFIQGLEAGINRMAWGPDGGLYVGGVGSTGNWQHGQNHWYGLQRLKYNGQPTFEMLAVRAKSNGMEIELTEPLPEGIGWNKSEYTAQQWWYQPTANYGGPKLDLEDLPIVSANVSADRKKIFLELDGLKPNHVVYLRLPSFWTSENGHELWSTESWYTLNNIPENVLGEKRPAQIIPPNTLTEAEKAAGWKLLFDGKTMDGWHNFNKETIGKGWVIDDDAIHLNAKKNPDGHWQAADGGDIVTDGQYENYELRLDWKIGACGNSGVIYNVVEDEKYDYVWLTGPEMQVLDNTCHPDAMYPRHRAGDLYDMIECKYETVKPAGEWNEARLVINNGRVEQWLNGRKLVEFEMFNDTWTQMIANSKFKDMPDFGKARKGHIALQDHGDRVWFRNVKIREL